ncbi:cytochrome P450 [Actinomycetospora soli]|uniref:cytochrome P450 n=1 Tax=Actinomycetospora soli TaxID=2893887 RepID=UPI001E5340F3|nr:cytochrome P450 [Actinomycetospora soli]MCD2189504.1 cytochrome P450 [Actinomycetospora soli]
MTAAAAAPDRPGRDPLDLSSLEFWSRSTAEREESFAELRRERPVTWHPAPEGVMGTPEGEGGFWALVRHEDIASVSKNPALFCSGQGVQFQDAPEELLEASQSFLAMDSPRHTQLRKIVGSAFTPKRIAKLEDTIATRAATIVDELLEHGDGDFVQLVCRRLPMMMIYDMMGVSGEQQDSLAEAADLLVAANDPEVRAAHGVEDPLDLMGQAMFTLLGAGLQAAEERRSDPRDDLMTNLVQAEVDGQRLTDEEIGAFFVLLSVAGNDTTRNTIAHTAVALTEFRDERRRLAADLDGLMPTAVEEMVRWASPVLTFRRTATQDTELRGQRIAAGDKVVMFYESGNRDTEVFADPLRFDVGRDPNPHQGFGGGGPHFCMGNMLARTQLREIWRRLLTAAPDFEVGEPNRLTSNFVNAVKSLPIQLNR